MSFPFLSENGFELGTLGHFDSETDTGSRLDFPHYTDLARIPGLAAPYRGAYCMRVDLSIGAQDAYVAETGAWDLAAGGTIFIRFMFWVSPNIVMANNDTLALLQLWSGASTVEGQLGILYTTAAGFQVFLNDSSNSSVLPLSLGRWHSLEMKAVIDSGVGNDGTLDGWLDGSAFTQLTGIDQAVITSGVFGVLAQQAGTTRGVILFDDIIADDTRIGHPIDRFPENHGMTNSGHAFVGPGRIDNLTLTAGNGTDCVVEVFDTDEAQVTDLSRRVLRYQNDVANQTVDVLGCPIHVSRGAYVQMSGTTPQVSMKIGSAVGYSSDGAVRGYGLRRRERPN